MGGGNNCVWRLSSYEISVQARAANQWHSWRHTYNVGYGKIYAVKVKSIWNKLCRKEEEEEEDEEEEVENRVYGVNELLISLNTHS